ncbi:hypothetical protein BDD12DRAFT_736574 [Trichophaea hybrida]|nr:hypothetical protein BDD12DRAFT_736574 [Trichophaea hybrida]
MQRSGSVHPYGPASRYPSRQNLDSLNAPPPPSLDHFPPLGKEIPKEKLRSLNSVLTQHADQPRGQQPVGPANRNAKSYHWRPTQAPAYYEQFFAEQALHLDQVAKRLLDKITPPDSETTAKHELLKTLERICKQLSPSAKLIPFGSVVTGFATASSDIDCVFFLGLGNDDITLPDYPLLLERKLQDEGFEAQLLLRTRIPIIKMVQRETPGCLQEIQCDIGFKNHLAIHNTQLLLTYSKCDRRLKDMVLFVKWWAKKRHINSPYRGTLSSYGYVLMILHYLINIVSPPVLLNLQLQPVSQDADDSEIFHRDGDNVYNIWFSRDTQSIPRSVNNAFVGELLRGFFDYYAYKFAWGQAVISIRTKGGLLTKQDKGWIAAKSRLGTTADGSETYEVKDRYLLALEDPFETAHNVGRTCTGPGVGRIRDELRRAMMLIKIRGDRGNKLGEHLCEEAPPERPYVRREDRDHKDPKSPEI